MKSLIITVAGMSSRFNKDTREDVLKCLYYEDSPTNSLLSLQVHKAYELVDEIIVVGGFQYEDLEHFIRTEMRDVNHKIKLVYNDHYSDYGSGYSLLKGIEVVSEKTSEITFIEGDLFFDTESIKKIITSRKDVISVNNEPILSSKAVALYFDAHHYPRHFLTPEQEQGTNLEIIQKYFGAYKSTQLDIVKISLWYNCNTVADYREAIKALNL